MAQTAYLDWFRKRLAASSAHEATDPQPVLDWRNQRASNINFKAELIPLKDVRGWSMDEGGNVRHASGQFFSIEGVRIEAGGLREVKSWDQPIINQTEGGMLVMVARETPEAGIEFLLQAQAAPGNIGALQLIPSIQCTWSNIKQAHRGSKPPLTELLDAKEGVRWIYSAQHNEEGGKYWRKANENAVLFLDDQSLVTTDLTMFHWASLSQIKALALIDNVLGPYVKSILAPL